jgi:peptidoglycan/LPS O-acetylase OafA/YrhL
MDLLTHLTFTFGFFPKYAVTNILPDWSIGLEMQFYLALPFMMLLYRRIGHFFATGLLIAIWAAATHLFSFGPDGPARLLGSFPMATFLPLKLNCFAVGILLAESYHFKQLDTRKSLLAFLLALVLVRLTFDRYAAVTACFAAVMLIYRGEGLPVALRKLFGSVQGIFGSRVSVFLADTSYSIYLFHLLALWPFGAWLSLHPAFRKLPAFDRFALLLGLTVLVAYPVAYLLHTYVEQPGIKLGKRFVRRHKPLARLQYLSPFSATHSTDFPF